MFFSEKQKKRPNKAMNIIGRLVTCCGLIRDPAKVKENSVPPEADFELS